MKFIAHRGLMNGPNKELENSPEQIDLALSNNFDVEIDLWYKGNKFYLGHDYGQYEVDYDFLSKPGLWIHCKNIDAIEYLSNAYFKFHYFWHQNDDITLTSNGIIWTYPGKQLASTSIAVMPETVLALNDIIKLKCGGWCSDHIDYIREEYGRIKS